MDVTRERIGRIVELNEMLLSFQTGFNFVNAVVVCAILGCLRLGTLARCNIAQVLEACYFELLGDFAGVVVSLVFSALISMP